MTIIPKIKNKSKTIFLAELNNNQPIVKPRKWSQFLALIPLYTLQFVYGMHTGFPAILTPQLSEHRNCSDFTISDTEESLIVSVDNLVTPGVCLISGLLQLKLGPKRVRLHIVEISRFLYHTDFT